MERLVEELNLEHNEKAFYAVHRDMESSKNKPKDHYKKSHKRNQNSKQRIPGGL